MPKAQFVQKRSASGVRLRPDPVAGNLRRMGSSIHIYMHQLAADVESDYPDMNLG